MQGRMVGEIRGFLLDRRRLRPQTLMLQFSTSYPMSLPGKEARCEALFPVGPHTADARGVPAVFCHRSTAPTVLFFSSLGCLYLAWRRSGDVEAHRDSHWPRLVHTIPV